KDKKEVFGNLEILSAILAIGLLGFIVSAQLEFCILLYVQFVTFYINAMIVLTLSDT
ncbi:hypothetical protein L9F63_018229, partial [Diploptera punctata]